jgi:hypothetical protein
VTTAGVLSILGVQRKVARLSNDALADLGPYVRHPATARPSGGLTVKQPTTNDRRVTAIDVVKTSRTPLRRLAGEHPDLRAIVKSRLIDDVRNPRHTPFGSAVG